VFLETNTFYEKGGTFGHLTGNYWAKESIGAGGTSLCPLLAYCLFWVPGPLVELSGIRKRRMFPSFPCAPRSVTELKGTMEDNAHEGTPANKPLKEMGFSEESMSSRKE